MQTVGVRSRPGGASLHLHSVPRACTHQCDYVGTNNPDKSCWNVKWIGMGRVLFQFCGNALLLDVPVVPSSLVEVPHALNVEGCSKRKTLNELLVL